MTSSLAFTALAHHSFSVHDVWQLRKAQAILLIWKKLIKRAISKGNICQFYIRLGAPLHANIASKGVNGDQP